VYYKRSIEARSLCYCYSGKAKIIIYSVCVCVCVSVALVIQHAKRMRRIIFSSVAYLALPFFSILSHKDTIFENKNLLNIKCLFFLQCLC